MIKKIKYIDGLRFYRAVVVGINNLISRQDYLNQINVFPVPDGDTGTNMAFTVSEILDGTSGTVSTNISEMTQNVADLALDGARGNSGAILAQFFVGFAEGLGEKKKMSVQDFSQAFQKASENAWDALSNPREGTILTIFKDLSKFLIQYTSENKNDDFLPLMDELLKKSKESVAQTPNQMKLLKKAGVVDAGAQGFVDLLTGINEFIQSGKIRDLGLLTTPKEFLDIDNNHDYSNLTYKFCTECILEGENIDKKELKNKLMNVGDSIVIAGSKSKVKIHIHVNKPNEFFEICNQYGISKNHKADDMFKQQELVQSDKSSKVAIVTDSSADFNASEYFDIFVVPVRYSFGNQGYIDKISQSVDDFYRKLQVSSIHPKTSQPTPGDFRRQYEYLNSYYRSIISIHLPAKLSGTYQSALTAAKNTKGAKISVLEVKNLSIGLGLILEKVSVMANNGLSHEKILKNINKLSEETKIFTALTDLSYSVKGGRIPKIVKTVSNIFNFKPILSVSSDGSLAPSMIYFGKKNMTSKFFNKVLKKIDKKNKYDIAIGHAKSEKEGTKLVKLFKQHPEIINSIKLHKIGGALGVHTGPGALSIAIQKVND